jgi:hypothetical protein
MILKRKTFEEFFINSFIVKNRNKLKNMTKHEKQIDDVKKIDLINEIYYIKKLKCINDWISVDVAKRRELKNRMKNQRQVIRYTCVSPPQFVTPDAQYASVLESVMNEIWIDD